MVPEEELRGTFVQLEQRGSILAVLAKIRSFKWIEVILAKNNEALK